VETLDEEFSEKDRAAACEAGFRLRRSGRYAHSPAYIHALADKHGFTVKHEEEVTVRTEQVS
jgi:predicted TPR repeat methyltransferase